MKKTVFAILSTIITIMSFSGSGAYAAPTPSISPPTLQWQACPLPPEGIPDAGQQCATLTVPLDYMHPNGQKITVSVSRISAAKPSERRGVLFMNPGGPGGPGLDLPRIATIIMPQSILNKYDLIGFDPRGVGTSSPLTCGLSGKQADQALPTLMQQGSFTATANFAQQVAQACGTHNQNYLAYFTTANTARDMDQIRQALGTPKINYFAWSYGTYLGAVYASLFPDSTDRFVLDSNVNPSWTWRQQFRSFGLGGSIRFPDFLNWAAAHDGTYHLGMTQDAVHNTYNQLMAKLQKNPITFSDGTVFNDAYFQEFSFFSISDPDTTFPDLATVWQAVNENQPLDLQEAPANDNPAASGLAIICNDAAWSRSPSQYQSELKADISQYPDFGQLGSNIWPCAFWPNATPSEPPVTISSQGATKILLVQNRRDPVTPYIGGLGMRRALGDRSRLLSVDAPAGHGITYLAGVACADDTVTAYLADGTLPSADASCQGSAATSLSSSSPNRPAAVRQVLRKMNQH
jgi:pimeloyl-ACP methyl ester carboxylesterase